jgi:hypothetical protein
VTRAVWGRQWNVGAQAGWPPHGFPGPRYVSRILRTAAVLLLAATPFAVAQEGGGGDLAAQLANPVAALISVPFQSNLDFGGGTGNALRYVMNFQPVVPLTLGPDWNLILRTIVPLQYSERVYGDHRFGLGDTVQSFFFSPTQPVNGITWGVGPVMLYPTATEGLGQRQWGAGPTGVVLRQSGPWIYGALANHIWSMGDTPDSREAVNTTFMQPFINYVFPRQTTLFLSTESTYDWSRRQWTVPINAGVSQLVNIGGQAVQLGAGIRYFAEAPDGGPDWGVRINLTFVFPR